jgi:hypothetical protein
VNIGISIVTLDLPNNHCKGIFITACGFTIAGVKTGLGGHNSELEQHDEINALKASSII